MVKNSKNITNSSRKAKTMADTLAGYRVEQNTVETTQLFVTKSSEQQEVSGNDQLTPRSNSTNQNGRSPINSSLSGESPLPFKRNEQQADEWGDEDGEFELEEEPISTEQSNTKAEPIPSSLNINKNIDQRDPSLPSPPETANDNLNKVEEQTTKYGRKVSKPTLYSPSSAKSIKSTSKIGKTGNRPHRRNTSKSSGSKRPRREQSPVVAEDVVCVACQEGTSPKHNRIVLCDSCDKPYHQLCHSPNIDDYVTEVRDASWFCSECSEDQHSDKKRKLKEPEPQKLSFGATTGEGLTENQKQQYLLSLTPENLVGLLLFSERLHPDLPIYPVSLKNSFPTPLVSHPIPKVVINSNDQARAIENQNNTTLTAPATPVQASISPPLTQNNAILSPTRPDAASLAAPQVTCISEHTFPMQTHYQTFAHIQEPTSSMKAHLPPSTTLIQAPQTSTFSFSLTTLSTNTQTIRAPQALLPNPVSAPVSVPVSVPASVTPSAAPASVNLPRYEEMIIEALTDFNDHLGTQPKLIFDKMEKTYPLPQRFRNTASQALQKAVKKGRIIKEGTLYKLNPDYKPPEKNVRREPRKPLSNNTTSRTASVNTNDLNIRQGGDTLISPVSASNEAIDFNDKMTTYKP